MYDKPDRLTDRQKDCLQLVAQGYTSKEIGRQLGLSPSTVDNHILAAMTILEAPSRAAAARSFVASDDRQKIPSQSQNLANPPISATLQTVADTGIPSPIGRLLPVFPPLGGQHNDLDWAERTIRIFQIAAVSLGIVLSLSLLIAGAFAVIR